MKAQAITWRDERLFIIDQTKLPLETVEIALDTLSDVWEAIKVLRIRGAPAIGICAAFGVVVGVKEANPLSTEGAIEAAVAASDHLATSRPTAVNLFMATDRMRAVATSQREAGSAEAVLAALEAEAQALFDEDVAACAAMGRYGAELVHDGDGVLTHCNTGALVSAGIGTALGVLYTARDMGRTFRVYADETRPLLQGARLTAWECMQEGLDVTLICDNMAAQVMREGRIQMAIVGADRIAANGDTANKIGTYGVAVLAKAHGIPFYVAAPMSTFDFDLPNGGLIPIEQRSPGEITQGFGRRTAPEGCSVYNPAFDVTPGELIAGIITEKGVLRPPYTQSIAAARG